jgi:hypothetical protein
MLTLPPQEKFVFVEEALQIKSSQCMPKIWCITGVLHILRLWAIFTLSLMGCRVTYEEIY